MQPADFTVERLAPGVHAVIARYGGEALSNSTIVDLGDTTVVFDSMLTPRAGAALAKTTRRLTGRRADFVVDSHYHHDHVWGNGAVDPVHVIATRRTRDLLARRGRDQFVSIRREFRRDVDGLDAPDSSIPERDRPFYRGWMRGVLSMPASFAVRVPEVTLDSEMTLHGARRTLRLITHGGGHSPSDLYAYLEDEQVVMMGDLVTKGMHPSVGDGYPRAWVRILDGVRRLHPDIVIPGHGPVGTVRDVVRVQEYLRDLIRLVRTAEAEGRSLASISIPDRYRRWVASSFFGSNLARVRREVRAERRKDR